MKSKPEEMQLVVRKKDSCRKWCMESHNLYAEEQAWKAKVSIHTCTGRTSPFVGWGQSELCIS